TNGEARPTRTGAPHPSAAFPTPMLGGPPCSAPLAVQRWRQPPSPSGPPHARTCPTPPHREHLRLTRPPPPPPPLRLPRSSPAKCPPSAASTSTRAARPPST